MSTFIVSLVIAIVLLIGKCTGLPAAPSQVLGNAERGAQLFTTAENGAPPCSTCHQVAVGQAGFALGPNLAGISERAATRVEGMSAEEYIHQSIVDPHRYIVPDYRDIMYGEYGTKLSEQDQLDIIAYLMTL
jgi:cytochrome c2